MNIDESQRIGENVGFAKVQQAKDFKCKDTGSITYDINWKYKGMALLSNRLYD